MATYNFKSSGTTVATKASTTLVTTPVNIGILTPMALGTTDIVQCSTNIADQVTDNFRNLLQTNWGERLFVYDYGANLRPIATELSSLDDFDTEAISRIKTATAKWMPYLDLQNFSSTSDQMTNQQTAVINVTVSFNVPSLNVVGKTVQVTIYAI